MDAEIQWTYQRESVNFSSENVKKEMMKDEEKFMAQIGGKLIAHGFQRELNVYGLTSRIQASNRGIMVFSSQSKICFSKLSLARHLLWQTLFFGR